MARHNHTHGEHIGGILDTSMKNGFKMNLKDAIEDVGVKVSDSTCLWEYPEIIRKNLSSNAINKINLKGKDIIRISNERENCEDVYSISTVYDTSNVNKPIYSNSSDTWGGEMSVDQVFTELFDNILPNVRGVHAGDMTVTDGAGNDTKEWLNTLFSKSGYKTGLIASSKYLRLYLTHQAEPLYIHIDGAVTDLTKGYNVVNSDTVSFELDDINMTMKAHVAYITSEQISNLK